MVAKYVFPVVFLPIDPDQVQNHSPHNLHHKVSYIQITTCHRHSIRKPLFFLVDENTVTTIPKLLFFSGVSKISCRSSLEKSQTLPKVTSGGPLEKGFEKQVHHAHGCSRRNRPQGDAVLQTRAPLKLSSERAWESCQVQSRQSAGKAVVASSLMCFLNFNLVRIKAKVTKKRKKQSRSPVGWTLAVTILFPRRQCGSPVSLTNHTGDGVCY